MLTIQQCRIFAELARQGSLNRAAAALDTAPPSLSRKLAAMEQAAGSALFHRTGRGLALSDLGERLLPLVEQLLDDAAQLESALDDASSVRGTVRIGLLPAGFNLMLSRLLREIQAEHPDIRLLISDGSSGTLEEALDAGRLDLAFITRVNAGSSENERLLTKNSIELYVPANIEIEATSAISLRELAGVPLIVPQMPNALRTALQRGAAESGIELNLRYEINSFGFQMHLLREGFGCYIGTRGTMPEFDPEGGLPVRALRFVEPEMVGSIVLAHSRHHPLTRAGRTVMDRAIRIARELRGSTVWETG